MQTKEEVFEEWFSEMLKGTDEIKDHYTAQVIAKALLDAKGNLKTGFFAGWNLRKAMG